MGPGPLSIFTPAPMGPFAALPPRAAILPRPAAPLESVAPECQVCRASGRTPVPGMDERPVGIEVGGEAGGSLRR